jgi:fructose-1,6-bisphosphatase/inositol monophosphatase family enzyme
VSGRAEPAENLIFVPKAAEIAREAGARLREFYAQGVETEYKGDVDIVTVADRAVEKLIRTRLGEAFPDHGVYGEEGTRERLEGEFRWYVDPLDGTTNFAHGFPQFCVSLGLEHRTMPVQRANLDHPVGGMKADEDGTLVAAVIYDPLRDEMFTAERGQGAIEWEGGEGFSDAGAGRGATGHGLSQPQAARKSQHSLLPGVHVAIARGAAGGLGGARPGVCGLRTDGCVLGVQSESMGYGGRNSAG